MHVENTPVGDMSLLMSGSAPYSLIVGLGTTGWSCARFLAAHDTNFKVVDSRDITPFSGQLRERFPAVQCALGGFDDALFEQAEEIIVSPGLSLAIPQIAKAREMGKSVIGDVELFARYVRAPVAAITGSNGKSTVTTLLGEMARNSGVNVAVGGNLGTPVLDLLATDASLYVIELSSFQLELTSSLIAETAVVLNVSADHLDRHGTLENYAAIKNRIYHRCRRPVINNDFVVSAGVLSPTLSDSMLSNSITYAVSEPVFDADFGVRDIRGEPHLVRGKDVLLAVADMGLQGTHNISNALAALALGTALNLPLPAMIATLRQFKGLPHRCELVAQYQDITFVDDSKGTNVGATVAAIGSIETPLVLIAGGDAKGADLSPLRDAVRNKVRAVILIGRAAAELEKLLAGVVETVHASDMRSAVHKAFVYSEAGDTVLLSPACSSLDMFTNYQARGRAFVEAVRELSK